MYNRSAQNHRIAGPQPGTLRRRARSLLIVSAFLTLPIVGVGSVIRHQMADDLLDRATRFADHRAWRSPDYFWIPPTTLVRVVAPSKGDWYLAKTMGPKLPETALRGITGSALHAKTVALEGLPAGESLLEQAPIIPDKNVVPGLSLSPDGKWLVCPGTIHDNTRLLLEEIRTRKQHVCTASYSDRTPGSLWQAWMPDSSAWVTALVNIDSAILQIRSVHAPDRIRSVHIQGQMGSLLGVTSGSRLLSTDFASRDGTSVSLKSCDLTRRSGAVKNIFVQLPTGQKFVDFALSPQGDRLIWITMAAPAVDGSKVPDRAHPIPDSRILPLFTFWVTRADGSGWNRVGSITVQGNKDQQDAPSDSHWPPDGAHVSFVYRKSLWTVPSDVAPR